MLFQGCDIIKGKGWKNRILTTIINTITLPPDPGILVEVHVAFIRSVGAESQLIAEMYLLLMQRFYHRIEKACTTFNNNDVKI